jgi:hypothetical protein
MAVPDRGNYVMDDPRGNFSEALDQVADSDWDTGDDDTGTEAPPSPVGQDERRMQVRAYNHWASLLDDRNFPSIEDLEPDNLPDFGPHSVLLDFTSGIENPGISYLGRELAVECGLEEEIGSLADVPSRSLLSRITDHYMQIIANQAPIGFEAEFVNQRDATILYRGILLPFSSDDDTIDFIYGVINWKELADQKTADELLLEIDQALENEADEAVIRHDDEPMTDWADGPAAPDADQSSPEDAGMDADATDAAPRPAPFTPATGDDLPSPSFGAKLMQLGGDDHEDDAQRDSDWDDFEPIVRKPRDETAKSPYASLENIGPIKTPRAFDEEDAEEDFEADEEPIRAKVPAIPQAFEPEIEPISDDLTSQEGLLDEAQDDTMIELGEIAEIDPEDMELGDWLASAREMAQQARTSEDRTRNALYEAVGRAYDFSCAAQDEPEELDELMRDCGLTMQDRAPMTPIVKLVFGADYDKTRLTEYAAVLSHAHRMEIERGALAGFLRQAEGGLKGVVSAERRLRREEQGKTVEDADAVRETLANKLRQLPSAPLESVSEEGPEFGLLMVRRMEDGTIALLGEVADVKLVERAGKLLVD